MVEKNQSRGPSPGQRGQSRGPARATQSRLSSTETEAYALPIRKTSPLIYLGVGVVVLGIAGAAFFTAGSGNSSEVSPEAKTSADAPAVLTKEEQKERLEHLRKTQAALEAAAAEEKAAGTSTKLAPSPAASTEAPPLRPAPASATKQVAAKAETPKAESPKTSAASEKSKKKAADLDALGADITSALQ